MVTNSRRRRLEECTAARPRTSCCSLCKNDLQTCWCSGPGTWSSTLPLRPICHCPVMILTGECAQSRCVRSKQTFRDTTPSTVVNEYMCLWWGLGGRRPPGEITARRRVLFSYALRPFCVQVAIQCANSLTTSASASSSPARRSRHVHARAPIRVGDGHFTGPMARRGTATRRLRNMPTTFQAIRAGALAPSSLVSLPTSAIASRLPAACGARAPAFGERTPSRRGRRRRGRLSPAGTSKPNSDTATDAAAADRHGPALDARRIPPSSGRRKGDGQ